MTKQEIFDKVARHLLTQNQVSRDPITDRCLYRGPDGLMCAIGCLIPDEKYDSVIEKHGVGTAIMRYHMTFLLPDDAPGDPGLAFLGGLQKIHDEFGPLSWRKQLRAFAAEWGLDASVLGKEENE